MAGAKAAALGLAIAALDQSLWCLFLCPSLVFHPLSRAELEEVAAEHPDRFKLWYTVDRCGGASLDPPPDSPRPTEGWAYSSGFISADMIQHALYPPSEDNLVSGVLPAPSC